MILRRGQARFAWRCDGFQILETGKDAQRRHGAKGPGLRWGKSAPRVRCDARPMPRHRASRRDEPGEHDLYYIENWSIGLDLKIILMTPFALLRGGNAY